MSCAEIYTDPAALPRDSYVQVDLAALAGNMDAIRAMVGPEVAVMPVIIANGYGLGAVGISGVRRKIRLSAPFLSAMQTDTPATCAARAT